MCNSLISPLQTALSNFKKFKKNKFCDILTFFKREQIDNNEVIKVVGNHELCTTKNHSSKMILKHYNYKNDSSRIFDRKLWNPDPRENNFNHKFYEFHHEVDFSYYKYSQKYSFFKIEKSKRSILLKYDYFFFCFFFFFIIKKLKQK